MNKALFILACAVTSCALLAATAVSQDKPAENKPPKKFQRQIFVPIESLDILLDGNTNRVLLSRAEYDQLLKSARTRAIKRAPLDSAIVSAQYSGEVSEDVALIKGELIVESLNEGLVQIPLPFSGVAIGSATIDGQPAKLWRNEKGQIVLLTSNQNRQRLMIEMTVPMQTSAARQSLSIQLPSPAATRFDLTVPGNVEVKSGAAVVNRVYDQDSNTTKFDLLPSRGAMNIVMSLNNRLLKDEQVTVSRSVLIHKLTPHTQQMHVTCSMNVIHGAVEQVEFTVPDGFQVSHVSTELLSQWEIKDPPEDSKETGKRLIVKLRQPTRADFVLNITAARDQSAVGQWTADDIRPVDVAGHVSVVGVLADIQLKSAKLVSDGVIAIDHAFLLAAIPESVKATGRGNPAAVVAAFYAPQKDYSISSSFSVPDPELIVKSNARLVIDDQMLELQGGISLISRHDSRFGFKMKLPNLWRLNELTGSDGQPMRFDRVGTEGSSEFLVHLPQRILATSATKVFFRASLTPAGWLEKWKSNQIEFPSVTIEGETKHTGAIAIATNEDLAIKPANAANLELLDDADKKKFDLNRDDAPLAYQFEGSDYKLSLGLQRLNPSIMARTYNYVTIKPTQKVVHAELVYDIKQAGESEFKFELPLDSPKSISIRAKNTSLKHYRSTDTETARQWIVQLAKPKKGKVHLLVDFEVPLEESDLAEIKLTPVLVKDVNFQSSMCAVEGSSELDIEIETEGRAVDVGEFSEAVYQPGRHLLGAYSWPNEKLTLTVKSARRPIYGLPSAIVQRAEMVTAISGNGRAQTAARFQLVTKQLPFMRVQLPQGATLWSVRLDCQPAKPQLQDGALLISLIGNKTGKLRDLQLVFESPTRDLKLFGKVQAQAPTLWLNETGTAEGDAVPLVDLHWRLIMPDGFTVSHSDGMFQSDQLAARSAPLEQLGDWIYRLGGGIRAINSGRVSQAALLTRNFKDNSPAAPGMELAETANSPMEEADFDDSRDLPFSRDDKLSSAFDSDGLSIVPQPQLPRAPQLDSAETVKETESFGFGRGRLDGGSGGSGGGGFGATAANEQKKASLWALRGLRSLDIKLTDTGNAIEFYNLGEQTTLTATVVNQARLNWIAIALAITIAALGVLLTNRRGRSKVLFLLVVLLIACLVPLVGASFDVFRTLVDLALMAAVFVALYFVVAAMVKLLGRSFTQVARKIPLYVLLIACGLCFTGRACAQEVITDTAQLKRLMMELHSEREVKLPHDAVIIPFDAEDPRGRKKADRLLLPYEHYLSLINKAENDSQLKTIDSPVDFVLSSANYSIDLTLEEDISIQGKLVIELMTDAPVAVALPLMGGALANASVDGQPAKLQFQPISGKKKPNPKQQLQQQAKRRQSSNSSIVQLYLEGRGTKTLEFTVQIKPDRQGGWRMLNARLPVGLTRGLNIKSLDQPTEVRLNSDADRRSIEAAANQKIATVLSADGGLRLQWKPSTATQTVDQSLTARSEAIFDVREDGLRLTWRVDLDFRGSERDVFTLNLPDGFLVEQVSGENVRAWDVKKDGESNRLNITTLSAAKDKETFTIDLSQRDFVVQPNAKDFDAPYLTVEGAALHKGVYTVRKSPIIELKTTKQQAANRIDQNQFKSRIDIGRIDAKSSPLGIESFQSLQFVTTPFQIGLQTNVVRRTIKAQTQSVLRIGQSEADLEMKVKVAVGKRPIYKLSFDLPRDAEIRSLAAGLKETWTVERIDDVQRVQLFFPSGVANDFAMIVNAELTAYSGGDQWSIPQVKINDAQEQDGYVAIQVDPALSVSTANLNNCETVLLKQVESWLNRGQRSMTRVVLRTRGTDYDATLRFAKIEPRVTVETVTNVRTTLFAIEETILLDFNIQQAGIRQIQFDLPASMREARVNARLVSETIVEDVAGNPDVVRVTLNLQDEVIDSFRVVVENDRQLSSDRQSVPVPRVLTGITEQRFVTLQNSGRDEINVLPGADFQTLNRQLKQFGKLKQKLAGGEVTMAYVALAKKDQPILRYETKQREAFDTVAASIEFSKTTMVVDSSGAYRALQNFQVNNRSEQYLEIELPEGAQLLTVLVEGQPVKPVAWPAAGNERRLRIPLVKTQLGDLDYPVQLKYGGRLGQFSNFREVEFPVIETLNINVQLSQLHLRLPHSHRWMNFGGTMTKVNDRGKLEEGYLSYKSRQIQQLAQQIQLESSKYGKYAQRRAYGNLKKLKSDMYRYEAMDEEVQQRGRQQVLDLVQSNNDAIKEAEESFRQQSEAKDQGWGDNRANFNGLLETQNARIARNSINKGISNFYSGDLNEYMGDINGRGLMRGKLSVGKRGQKEADKSKNSFDGQWLSRNQLQGAQQQFQANESGQSDKQAATPNQPMFQGGIVVQGDYAQLDDSISFSNSSGREKGKLPPVSTGEQLAKPTPSTANLFGDSQDKAGQVMAGRAMTGEMWGVDDQNSGEITGDDPFAIEEQAVVRSGRVGRENLARDSKKSKLGVDSAGGLGASLSSLDIELPERGVDFYFKSPRGKATVIVRPLDTRSFSRWTSVAVTLGVCLGAAIACWLFAWLWQKPSLRVAITLGLLIGGWISLAAAFLPVYGLISLLAAFILILDWLTRKIWQDTRASVG